MVVHPLHQVARQFRIKERHWQLQQLDEKLAYQGYVDAHRDAEQEPSAHEVYHCTTDGQHQLPQKYQPNEPYVLVFDADIHDRLGEKWQYQLKSTAKHQS